MATMSRLVNDRERTVCIRALFMMSLPLGTVKWPPKIGHEFSGLSWVWQQRAARATAVRIQPASDSRTNFAGAEHDSRAHGDLPPVPSPPDLIERERGRQV